MYSISSNVIVSWMFVKYHEERYICNVFYRSSHNLHDPMRIGTLPPTGLVSRQQSSPNLNPNATHMNAPNVQGTEAERFYQNLSIYRNQDSTVKQQISSQQLDDRYKDTIQFLYILNFIFSYS